MCAVGTSQVEVIKKIFSRLQIKSDGLVLCRTSNRSMFARSRSEKCAFVLARSSKMSFFVRISVRYSEMLAVYLMFI